MALNKSDKNYIILILIVLISVLSLKVRPIKFRLILKTLTLIFILLFLYKKDFKVSLFLTLLLFSLNQNGIGNSVDYFSNHEYIPPRTENECYLKCYLDETVETMDECDNYCNNMCKANCALELKENEPIISCNDFCDVENFQNQNNNEEEMMEEMMEEEESTPVPTTTERQPFESDEKNCRIKCLQDEFNIIDCRIGCKKNCVNTCTSSDRTYRRCLGLCNQ